MLGLYYSILVNKKQENTNVQKTQKMAVKNFIFRLRF